MIGKLNIGGGGLDIQGVTQQYTAREDLKAGDFASYFSSDDIKQKNSTILLDENSHYSSMSILKIKENKYLLFNAGSSQIMTINNGVMDFGTAASIGGNCILLSENKGLRVYNNSNYLYGSTFTIEGTTITDDNNATMLTSNSYTGDYISLCLIDENTVFVTHSGSSNNILNALVVSINGNTITATLDTTVDNSSSMATKTSMTKISNDKILIAYGSNYNCYLVVVSLTNNVISSIGTKLYLTDFSYYGNLSPIYKYGDNKYFILLANDTLPNSTYYNEGYITPFSVSDTTITINTNISVYSASAPSNYRGTPRMIGLQIYEDLFLATYFTDDTRSYNNPSSGAFKKVKMKFITVENDNFSVGSEITYLETTETSSSSKAYYLPICLDLALIDSRQSIVIYNYNWKVYGDIAIFNNTGVYKTTYNSDTIAGITKEKALRGNTVNVYIPDYLD